MFLKINDCIKNNRRNSTKVSKPLSWTAISQAKTDPLHDISRRNKDCVCGLLKR